MGDKNRIPHPLVHVEELGRNCPDCGGSLRFFTVNGVTAQECSPCGVRALPRRVPTVVDREPDTRRKRAERSDIIAIQVEEGMDVDTIAAHWQLTRQGVLGIIKRLKEQGQL